MRGAPKSVRVGKLQLRRERPMSSDYFATFARYNAWANRRLYQACAGLSEHEYLRERPSTLGSLHAALNRILVADRVWIARIEGRTPPGLDPDQILYADLIGLKVARSAEDEHLCNLVEGVSEDMLDRPLVYRNARGKRFEVPLRLVLGHLFDYQAQRRGEAQALLAQTGVRPPSLGLICFVGEQGGAVAR
jgi:uncharacterized damage-inducible protein DinB